jgi:DNA helicase-2/ATP-dependent DNA helicase PcrA
MSELNVAQKEATETLEGPLLILAGAGAGKTKTIVERIANLVKKGVAPYSILAITFTNKAAGEMKERVAQTLEAPNFNRPISVNERPFVSTFHALGVHILREQCSVLGIPRHFAIFDRGDSKQLVRDSLKKRGYDPKQFDPNKILGIISKEKGDAVRREAYTETVAGDYIGSIVAQVWEDYEGALAQEKALDFDDLLTETLKLLERPEIRAHYQSIWKYINVDEYQDTNIVQYKIVRLLAEKEKNICVVGDIDQNIYSWRGAKLKNIFDFERDYPGAKVIILEENYRSTKIILDAANAVIKKNVFRKEKNLFTKNPTGEPISLFEAFDEVSEAEFVATKSAGLIEGGSVPEEIAVLYRANFQSRALEEAFISYGVAYQLIGTRFFERKEVKDIIGYIRVALEPENLSDLKRVVNVPPRGIGKVSFLKIAEGKANLLPKQAREEYESFLKLLEKIKIKIETEKPSDTVRFVLKESGIEDMLSTNNPEDEERLENIKELVTIATRYDNTPGLAGIEQFLTNASLQSDQDELQTKKEGVKLMTVHAAKGLEFDNVFIVGLEDGLFPHNIDSEKGVKNEDDEEERRLFYVALTRARKKLFISYAQIRTLFGKQQVNMPSEFISDIPEESVVREEGTFGLLRRKSLLRIDF